jgi:hypothetical protein
MLRSMACRQRWLQFHYGCALRRLAQPLRRAIFSTELALHPRSPDRGQPLARTIEMIRYCGFRWVRAGIEGLTETVPTTMHTFLDLHRETGVRLSLGIGTRRDRR